MYHARVRSTNNFIREPATSAFSCEFTAGRQIQCISYDASGVGVWSLVSRKEARNLSGSLTNVYLTRINYWNELSVAFNEEQAMERSDSAATKSLRILRSDVSRLRMRKKPEKNKRKQGLVIYFLPMSACLRIDANPSNPTNSKPILTAPAATDVPICCYGIALADDPPLWSGLLSPTARAAALRCNYGNCLNCHEASHSCKQCTHPFARISYTTPATIRETCVPNNCSRGLTSATFRTPTAQP